MKLFTNLVTFMLTDNMWVALICAIVIFLIGLIIVKKGSHKTTKKETIIQFPTPSLHEAIKDVPVEEIVNILKLTKYPTINIYWNPSLKVDLHNTMVNLLVAHLLENGFRFCMPDDEVQKMEEWRVRILVIDVFRKVYFFHGDPFEDRTKTVSYEILTNDIHRVTSEIDNRIILMQGLNGGKDE